LKRVRSRRGTRWIRFTAPLYAVPVTLGGVSLPVAIATGLAMKSTRVIAAVVEREGRWLLGRRPKQKQHGDLWEFPGGKLESGETPHITARRELREELELRFESVGECLLAIADPDSPYLMEFFEATVSGHATARALRDRWFTLDELATMPLAPADKAFSQWLAEFIRTKSATGPQP
jgi:8-oxo-dGTP diphosphatase